MKQSVAKSLIFASVLLRSSLSFTSPSRANKNIAKLPIQAPLSFNSVESTELNVETTASPQLQQEQQIQKNRIPSFLISSCLCTLLLTTTTVITTPSSPVFAYESSSTIDTDAVERSLQQLKTASGHADATLQAYEAVASIITEGTGVGGSINFKGVQLDRGYVADEDTSIYNPGLTLMTESEKERLVQGVIASRNEGIISQEWNAQNQFAFDFLRGKLDPLHMVELRGYLSVLPVYAAVVYASVLAVQQAARNVFPVAYFVGVAAIVLPIIGLIVAGPH
jgi:hypothetical protein